MYTPTSARLTASWPRSILLVSSVFLFFFAAYSLTQTGDIFSTGDTTIRMELAENILGRWSVDLHGWKLVYPKHVKQEWLDPRISTGRLGKTYTTYELGQPLAIVPFDKLGSMLAVHERWPYGPAVAWFDRLVGPLFGALEVSLFFVFAARLYGLRRSLLLTLIFAFATSVWPDEQSVLEHTEVAFSLLLGFYFAFRFREQGRGEWYLILSGLSIGIAVLTRYQDAALGAVAVCVYLIWPGGRTQSIFARFRWLVLLGIGLVPSLITDLWYSWVRFGSLFATGHHEHVFGYPILLGVPGLLVSPGKGLIWYCPIVLLVAITGRSYYRRVPAFTIASIVMVGVFVLLYAHVTYWHGDPAWGPRYLYPLLPFFTLPLGELFFLRTRWKPALLAIAIAVILGSLTVQVAAVSVNQWRSWYKVIAYEENQGQSWQWIAARYRYFWNVHESPLNFQLRGLYQMGFDTINHSTKYELVPPDEDPTLDGLTTDYAVNQWSFWWAANEFSWWFGEDKIILMVTILIATMLASGTYVAAETFGLFASSGTQSEPKPVPEAA